MPRNEALLEELQKAAVFARYYAETRDAVLIGNRSEAERLADELEHLYARSWMTEVFVTKVIYRNDGDKGHRCPVCHTISDEFWESSKRARRWRVYTCRYGHRFSQLPFITKEHEYEPIDHES